MKTFILLTFVVIVFSQYPGEPRWGNALGTINNYKSQALNNAANRINNYVQQQNAAFNNWYAQGQANNQNDVNNLKQNLDSQFQNQAQPIENQGRANNQQKYQSYAQKNQAAESSRQNAHVQSLKDQIEVAGQNKKTQHDQRKEEIAQGREARYAARHSTHITAFDSGVQAELEASMEQYSSSVNSQVAQALADLTDSSYWDDLVAGYNALDNQFEANLNQELEQEMDGIWGGYNQQIQSQLVNYEAQLNAQLNQAAVSQENQVQANDANYNAAENAYLEEEDINYYNGIVQQFNNEVANFNDNYPEAGENDENYIGHYAVVVAEEQAALDAEAQAYAEAQGGYGGGAFGEL